MKMKRTARGLGQSKRYSLTSVERLEDRLLLTAIVDIDLQPGSDTGASNTDNITNDNTPTYDVTVNGPGDIELDYDGDGNVDDSLAVGAAGTYAFTCVPPTGDLLPYYYDADLDAQCVADFNGDGNLDVGGGWKVALGNGDGTFGGPIVHDPAWEATAGDINNDAIVDLVISNYMLRMSVSVLLGNGDGTMQAETQYPCDTGSSGIEMADFNRDGNLDVVTTCWNDWSVCVLLGNGDGTLQPYTSYPMVEGPMGLAVADFNGDGWDDIAAAITAVMDITNQVAILINDGDGTFTPGTTCIVGMYPYCLESADLNGDGAADMVVGQNPLSVVLGNGDGTFQVAQTYPVPSFSRGLAVVDMNADGNLDIVAPNTEDYLFSVLFSNGDGTFGAADSYTLAGRPNNAMVGDFNNDGTPDVVCPSFEAPLAVLLNTSGSLADGVHPAEVSFTDLYESVATDSDPTTIDTAGPQVSGMVPASVTNTAIDRIVAAFDEALDVATAQDAANYDLTASGADGSFGDGDEILLNSSIQSIIYSDGGGAGPFTVTLTLNPVLGDESYQLTIDGDTSVKDIAGNSLNGGDDEVRAFIVNTNVPTVSIDLQAASDSGASNSDNITNDSTPTFDVTVNRAGTIEIDWDGNGTTDDLLEASAAGTYEFTAELPNGALLAKQDYVSGDGPRRLAFADLNEDGVLDLVANNWNSDNASVYIGNGDGTFKSHVTYSAGDTPYDGTISDFNGDANADLAFVNYNANTISILRGNGNGTFQARQSFAVQSRPLDLASADFNRDGITDLALTCDSYSYILILKGNGDGTFQSPQSYLAGTRAVIGTNPVDLNGDGFLDIFATSRDDDTLSVHLGNGNGTFQSRLVYAAGDYPCSSVAADINGDGKIDIAATAYNEDKLSVFIGNGDGTFADQVKYAIGDAPSRIQAGDINNDGYPDLATSNQNSGNVSVCINKGDGSFETAVAYASGSSTQDVIIADFNGDRADDIAAVNFNSDRMSVFHAAQRPLEDGAYGVNITFTDAASGVAADSDPTTIDTVPPVVVAMTPQGGIPILVAQIVATFDEALDVATAQDSANYDLIASGGDGTFGDGNEISLNSRIQSIVYADGGGAKPFTVTLTLNPVLGDESYQLTIDGHSSVKDLAGNLLKGGSDEVRAFMVDTIAPVVTIDLQAESDSGASNADNITNDNTPTFNITVSEAGTIRIDYDGDGIVDRTVAVGSAGTYEVGTVGDGERFITYDSYLAGSNPEKVEGTDLNGDGWLDLVSTDYGSNQISVFLAIGDGTFAPRAAYAAGSSPNGVSVGDVNGDGKVDVVVGAYVSSQARACVFLGNGDGTLQPYQSYTIGGSEAGDVFLNDFNADGNLDIAGTNFFGDQVAVLRGNGDGTFQTAQPFAVGDEPYCVFSTDLNGDSVADIVTANSYSSNLSVLFGNGDGTFQTQQTYSTGLLPRWVRGADLDGDSDTDLVSANSTGDSVSVLLNNGNGTFQAKTDYPAGDRPLGLVISDLNGDGLPDVVVSDRSASSLSLLTGNGDGTLAATETLGAGAAPTGLYAGDLDGDSHVDLAVACAGDSDEIAVLLSEGTPDLRTNTRIPMNGTYAEIVAVDLNMDGILDLAGVNSDNGAAMVLLGNGDGSFDAPTQFPITVGLSYGILCADLNNDALPDLAATDYDYNTVSVVLGNGDGSFQTCQTSAVASCPIGLCSDDLDGDGNQDIVVANTGYEFDGTTVSVLFGNGDGTFQPRLSLTVGMAPTGVVAGDFDNDGNSDIVSCNFIGMSISLLRGNGDRTFQTALTYSMPSAVGFGCYASDFNGDGILDLATAGQQLYVLLGNGDGTFQPETSLCSEVIDVTGADVDGDGDTDLLASESPISSSHPASMIFLMRGNGDGTFDPPEAYPAGSHFFLSTGDLNGDGRIDVLTGVDSIGILFAETGPLADGVYPMNVTFTDVAGHIATDSDPTTIDTVSPEVAATDGWQIAATHGGGVGELVTTIANGYVESRYQGIKKLVINMDEAMNPGSVSVSDLSIVGVSHGDQSSLITSAVVAGNKITIGLSAALPDIDTYTVTLGSAVEDLAGNSASGISQITVKALRGDANGDGQVNSFDLLNIRAFVGQAVTAANARRDINGDGVINSFDQLMARVYVGNKIT
ncbi:MAG TPA: FG-GAP-like repeat-containing protein [Candidatus Brocadiia bacterium]|nr:FG-GAP-like repeat-containing protein [Candidatus Brocadiia bacterium]